jgi:CheY-like chemotaxis protein/anti-sigma regulatory factor (Ser/Thr protein kinase)
MERQLRHLTRLIDDLLDVGRIRTGRIVLRLARTELADVVAHALEGARPRIEAAGHRLTVTLPQQPIPLHADPIRLAQVVGNLLDNARKYTESNGQGHIQLTVERAGDDVALCVRDNGMGIPPDMLARIFDMFTQVDRTIARAQEGLGIGLSLVKTLVEMHGGSVSAHSEGLGTGCAMTVRLPLAVTSERSRAGASPDATSAATAPGAATGEPRRTGVLGTKDCRILVVDDNRDSAETLARLLALGGNTVRTAHDGMAALEAAAAFEPDAVLLDIGLPKLDGYEVARRLRAAPRPKLLVLLAVTGRCQEEDRALALAAGFDEHLVKPLDPEALTRRLAELLQPAAPPLSSPLSSAS